VARPFSEVPQLINPPVTSTCTDGKETYDVLIMRNSVTFNILPGNGSYPGFALPCLWLCCLFFLSWFFLSSSFWAAITSLYIHPSYTIATRSA
jgi:hypothetical protein